jgi:hypothetical protein
MQCSYFFFLLKTSRGGAEGGFKHRLSPWEESGNAIELQGS